MDQLTYSNPRVKAVIPDWPSGSKRVTAIFYIERGPGSKGERAVRVTTGNAKKRTYARFARIVDGSDGKTYIAEISAYGGISIMQSNMKFQQETIYHTDPRYAAIKELFAADVNWNEATR